jgi:hypothetical protein
LFERVTKSRTTRSLQGNRPQKLIPRSSSRQAGIVDSTVETSIMLTTTSNLLRLRRRFGDDLYTVKRECEHARNDVYRSTVVPVKRS